MTIKNTLRLITKSQGAEREKYREILRYALIAAFISMNSRQR